MTHNLKPCPFCGDEPTLRKSQAPFRAEYMVICVRGCGACNGWKDTVDEAIAAWNTRQEPDDLIRTVKTRINELYDSGYCIIINSCRARDKEDEMIDWLNRNGVKYCHCNENCCERIVKYRTDCRKISADCIIDDKSLMMVNMEQENAWHNVKHMFRLKFGENHERECGKE